MYDTNPFSSNLGYLGQAGRRGSIPWGKIKSTPQLLVYSRFLLKSATFGDPMRIQLRDLREYWKSWAFKESEGDPFSFYSDKEERRVKKGKGRPVEEDGGEDEEEEQDQDQEEGGKGDEDEDEEESPVTTPSLPKPPIAAFEIDEGIFLPSQCENSSQKVACLQLLAPEWGDEGATFHSLIERVATLEVSVQPLIIFMSNFHHQDTDQLSGFKGQQWPYCQWKWKSVHLSGLTHSSRELLQEFLKWLQWKASELLKLKFAHKNQFLDLLLGVGLYLRDVYFACSSDHEETSIPDYLEGSLMELEDSGRLLGILKLLSKVMDHTMR